MNPSSERLIALLVGAGVVLASAVPSEATTFLPLDQTELAGISDAVIIGTVLKIESGRDIRFGEIHTDIRIAVSEILSGNERDRNIVVREVGGRLGGEEDWTFGAPTFRIGEEVLVFLTKARNATYRVTGLALGKFTVRKASAGATQVVRDLGEGVNVRDRSGALVVDPAAEEMPISAAIRQKRRDRGDMRRHDDVEPRELEDIEEHDEFTYLGRDPARWFESDWGESLVFQVDPTGDPGSELGPTRSVAAIHDAFDSWSTVYGSALAIIEDEPLPEPLPFAGCSGGNRIVFNDPFNEIADPHACGGVLAVGGYCTTVETKVIDGTEFRRIRVGKVMFNNGWADCLEWNRCNLAEIAAHEIGHTLGLGHSSEADAIMRAFAYFDGRCATLGSDDEDAMRFMYPPGILVDTPTPTPTRTPAPTPTTTFIATPTTSPSSVQTSTWTPIPTPILDTPMPVVGHNRVHGEVRYFMWGSAVPGAEVTMTGSNSQMEITGVDGTVEFSDVLWGTTTLRGAKFDDIRSISALDAAFAPQSAVGLRELSPLQRIACDVTGNGSVSALDASRILQFALGSIATFPVAERCGSPWWIVPGQTHAELAISPVLTPVTCSPGGFDLSALQDDVMDLSFDALLFGDCTGDWATGSETIPAGAQRGRPVLAD